METKKTTNTLKTPVSHIIFDGEMRKTIIEGVLKDIKGMFEQKNDGKIQITYEDFNLKNCEFGFKFNVKQTLGCSKQKWSETISAIVNVVNYMFPADGINIDVSISSTDSVDGGKLEVDLVSNW